jgi:hypothetical protein
MRSKKYTGFVGLKPVKVYVPDQRPSQFKTQPDGEFRVLGHISNKFFIRPNGEVLKLLEKRGKIKTAKHEHRADGRVYVCIDNGIENKHYLVQKLVASVYLTGERDRPILHKDGNKANVSVANLEYLDTDVLFREYATEADVALIRAGVLTTEFIRTILKSTEAFEDIASKIGNNISLVKRIKGGFVYYKAGHKHEDKSE